MNADWYYIADGWMRKGRRVGPITETDLLERIEKGKIQPQTLLQSTKTKGKWVPMTSVGPAIDCWRAVHGDSGLSHLNDEAVN